MSSPLRLLAGIGLIALTAACARQQQEPVVVEPAPVAAEPQFEKF